MRRYMEPKCSTFLKCGRMRARISQLPACGMQEITQCPFVPLFSKWSAPSIRIERAISLSLIRPVRREQARFIVVRTMLRRTMELSLSARSVGETMMRKLRATILRRPEDTAQTR